MKKGADAPAHIKFKRAIKKRRRRAYKSKHPTVKFKFVEVANVPVPKLSWWRRFLKWLHLV